MSVLRVTISANPPNRLDKALARDTPEQASLSRSRLARLIRAGSVSRDGQAMTDPGARVATGDILTIDIPQVSDIPVAPEAIPLAVRYEDDHLIVIDKPAGMVVHPAPGAPSGTLVNALLAHCGDRLSGINGQRRPGIVHRIDKDTSGLLVVAKSDCAHHGLARQFAAHTVSRHYRAVVYGAPDGADPRLCGTPGLSFEAGGVMCIATGIARHRHDRQRQAVVLSGGRRAVTRARVVERFGAEPGAAAVLDCWLETGRTHQIRVHMAHAGHGLIGDPLYGGRRSLARRAISAAGAEAARAFPRQALHAATLGFVHPTSGETMRFAAPLPADMSALIEALRGGLWAGSGGSIVS